MAQHMRDPRDPDAHDGTPTAADDAPALVLETVLDTSADTSAEVGGDAAAAREEAEAHSATGRAHFERREWSEAETHLREALRLDPKNAKAHGWLGIVQGVVGKLAEAEESCREALRLDPKNAKAHYNLGIVRDELGKHAEAEESFREALRLDPKDAKAHYNLGVLLDQREDTAGAEKNYRLAIDLNPEDADTRYRLEALLKKREALKRADRAKAAKRARQALRDDAECAVNCGCSESEKGELVALPCEHYIHRDCLMQMAVAGRSTCPLCRMPMTTSTELAEQLARIRHDLELDDFINDFSSDSIVLSIGGDDDAQSNEFVV